MAIKVHPGIGVARAGDSPFVFVGPETPFDTPAAPPGGFRDAECRIKRQAALFRVYEDVGGTVGEVTANASTTITWTVRLRTTAFGDPEVSLASTSTLPASITVDGNVVAEMVVDSEGRLKLYPVQAAINIGASIDTRCEGYVHASIVRDSGPALPVDPSWVVIYPPDFAPGLDPSSGGAAGTLLRLWPMAPATSPALPYTDQLDRGPLSFVGQWEAGGTFGALTAAAFMAPFRFLASGPPGSLRNSYGNWASDLYGASLTDSGCGHLNWVSAVGVGGTTDSPIVPTASKGRDARIRGFLVEQPDSSLEYVDWCPVVGGPALVNFFQVPRGTERAVPIQLELKNFPVITSVESEVLDQPNARLDPTPWNTPVVPENDTTTVTRWAFFNAELTTPLGLALGTIEFRFGGRHTVSIPLQAEVVEPTRLAIGLVLDCSDSMRESRGDTHTRLEGLKEAVNVFLDVARPLTAVATAPFSTTILTSQPPQILGSGDATDSGRRAVRDFVADLSTHELTSIGAGIQEGHSLITRGAVADYESKALLVVTDGYETSGPYINEIADSISVLMYAIGIGPAFEPALAEIAGESGGSVSIMGSPVSSSNRYTLEKYFLQVFALTHGDVLVDPEGELAPGASHRISFMVCDADMGLNLIVVSDVAARLTIAIEGPTGDILSLEQLRATGRCRVTRTARVGHVELTVPFDAGSAVWGPGEWAIRIANVGPSPTAVLTRGNDGSVKQGIAKQAASYLAMVTTSSALRLDPTIARSQDAIVLEAAISYGGAPILRDPKLFAELATPWGARFTLPLLAVGPGLFRASLATTRFGSYRAAFRARGNSLRGLPFQRERVVETFFAAADERRPTRGDCDCCQARAKRRPVACGIEHKLLRILEKRCRWMRG